MIKQTAFILALLPALSSAQTWQGTGELGFTSTSGNTDSQTLNSKLDFNQKKDKWAHAVGVNLLKSSTNNVDSADSLVLTEKTDYTLSDKAYIFAGLRYEDDKFSGFDSQSSITAGMGSRLIENEKQILDVSAGLGFRQIKSIAGDSVNDGILNIQAKYHRQLSVHASFAQDFLVELGDSNTHTESISALKMKIAGNLSSVLSYSVKNNSDVPTGVKKTDAVTTVSLAYDF